MAIEVIKLISGEEVIAKVEEKDNNLLLKTPVLIAMTHDGVAMIPFMPYANHPSEGVAVAKSAIILRTKAIGELMQDYQSKFVTGIVVPTLSLKG